MSKVLVNESSLTGIANAIRGKNGSTTTYKPSEMAAAITAISGGGGPEIPESAFVIMGNCNYWDYNGKWDKFITAYSDKWSTSNIIDASYMLSGCKLAQIPFEINLGNHPILSNMFNASKLTTLPQINGSNIPVQSMYGFLSYSNIQNIPNDYFNFIGDVYDSWTNVGYMFSAAQSLRNFPSSVNIIPQKSRHTSNIYSFYRSMCDRCYVLDEINNLGVATLSTFNSNAVSSMVESCSRLKNFTFEAGKTVNWKNQTLELSSYVGYAQSAEQIKSKIPLDKRVSDAASYAALKDDPDWWTTNIAYSRYNHDSAVATINSLPDTSAYLASAGGTNTIKFKGAAGSSTYGGAINTLTEEEIAVATAKGWSVSLV